MSNNRIQECEPQNNKTLEQKITLIILEDSVTVTNDFCVGLFAQFRRVIILSHFSLSLF